MNKKYFLTESQIQYLKKFIIKEDGENSSDITSADYCSDSLGKENPNANTFWKQENTKNPEQNVSAMSPAEYEPKLKNKTECAKFQTWVKKNYPNHNLGPFGPKKDGVDGLYGKRTKEAWRYYGKKYLSEMGSNNNQPVSPLKQKIKTDIRNLISRAKQEYLDWYSNPGTVGKFKNKNLVVPLKQYISSLGLFKDYYDENSTPVKNAYGWVYNPKTTTQLNEPRYKTINLNVFSMHDGKNYISPMDQTIKHEMGHIIDNFLTKNGEPAYLKTHENFNQEQYMQNNIINDADQFTRLQVFRKTVGAAPLDNGEQLLDKFLNKYQSGEIKISGYTPSKVYLNQVPEKNDTTKAKRALNFLNRKIIVDGVPSSNISQLFATFTITTNITGQPPNYSATLYTSFDKIGELNITSKGVNQNLQTEDNKRYVYLKLTPIQTQQS